MQADPRMNFVKNMSKQPFLPVHRLDIYFKQV